MKKNKLGIVSYIGIGILVLIVVGFLLLYLAESIRVGGFSDYDALGFAFLFIILLPYFIYYVIVTIISVVIDLNKGKSQTKDIVVSVFYVVPVILTIAFVALLYIIGS